MCEGMLSCQQLLSSTWLHDGARAVQTVQHAAQCSWQLAKRVMRKAHEVEFKIPWPMCCVGYLQMIHVRTRHIRHGP